MIFITKYIRTVIFVCALASVVHYCIDNKTFTFNAIEVKKIAAKYAGQHPNSSLQQMLTDIRRRNSKHLVSQNLPNWFTLGGDLQLKMYLIHVSLTEYLAIVGAPSATTGHAGIHWMNQSCSILHGSAKRWKDGVQLTKDDAKAGDSLRFAMFEGSVLNVAEDTWALCYGRGFVPASIPYLGFNFLTHSTDPVNAAQLLYTATRTTFNGFLHWFEDQYMFYSKKWLGK